MAALVSGYFREVRCIPFAISEPREREREREKGRGRQRSVLSLSLSLSQCHPTLAILNIKEGIQISKCTVFQNVTQFSVVQVYQRFGGTYCLIFSVGE
jgi:hypothetical protein